MKELNAPNCGRENDLVAFLYGELTEKESQIFRRHLHDCAACSTELATFQTIRESVLTWRNESLGGVMSPSPHVDSSPTRLVPGKPSAAAALREFFNLAPLWMKGALAFASILFCLFAGLAVAHLRSTPPAATATNQGGSANSEQQLNAMVEKRVQEELRRINAPADKGPPSPSNVLAVVQAPRRRVQSEVANNRKARRPLSKTEREQLAADLRLISGRKESELDLLDDGINQ
jgi:Putative zinc-finger